jgi:guanylate kinase
VFLLPPSLEELEARLRGRGSDGPEVIRARLELARRELAAVELFDYVVVNDALDRCVAAVREVIEAERRGDAAPARRRHGRDVVWPTLAERLR